MFDADAVVSELLTRDNICRKIQKVFGDESIDESGLINRKFIREQVFDSVNQRAKLESILHLVKLSTISLFVILNMF